MKKIFYSIFVLSGLLLSACTQDSHDGQADETKFMVNLGADLSFSQSSTPTQANPPKRSIDENAFKNIQNYTVALTKTSTGEIIHTALYRDWELAYMVEPNTEYKLSASYGNEVPAGYDDLLVSGEATFTVQPGTTKVVNFTCIPKAIKVNVAYSNDFTQYYSDCEVSIRTKHMTEAWTMSKSDAGKDLYLKSDENGENVELAFKLLDKNGNIANKEGVATTKTVNVSPKTLLKITFKPEVTEIEGGKIGLNVTVDTGVKDENIDIQIPQFIF